MLIENIQKDYVEDENFARLNKLGIWRGILLNQNYGENKIDDKKVSDHKNLLCFFLVIFKHHRLFVN